MKNRILLNKFPLGIMIFDRSLKVIVANNASDTIISEMGQSLFDIIISQVVKAFEKNIIIEKIIKYVDIDDFYVWKVKTEPLKCSPPQIIVTIQDTTSIYIMEQSILKAEKLTVLGHIALSSLLEMRNPLTSALGFCQLMKQHSENRMEYIEIIAEELEEIQNIIENCTSIARTSSTTNYLEIIYKKICACLCSQNASFRLIMVSDDFDNLAINIAEDHVTMVVTRLINILNIWDEEDINIIINVDLHDAGYLNLNIKADFAITDFGKDHKDIIESMEGINEQIELRLINDHTIAFNFLLSVIIPHSIPKSQDENTEVFDKILGNNG